MEMLVEAYNTVDVTLKGRNRFTCDTRRLKIIMVEVCGDPLGVYAAVSETSSLLSQVTRRSPALR